MEPLKRFEFDYVYVDHKNEERAYLDYQKIISNIIELVPFSKQISNLNVENIEKNLSLTDFLKLKQRGNLCTVSNVFLMFSEYAIYDPIYLQLKAVEFVFTSNEDLYKNLLKKLSKTVEYMENHSLRKTLKEEKAAMMRNTLINNWFSPKRTISVCKGIVEIDDEVLFSKIDKFFQEMQQI